jgi:hypothetical protein
VPLGEANAVAAPEVGEDVVKAGDPVRGQLQRLLDGVDDPAEDALTGALVPVTFGKLGEGGDVLPARVVVSVDRPEDAVEGVEEAPLVLEAGGGPALDGPEIVI